MEGRFPFTVCRFPLGCLALCALLLAGCSGGQEEEGDGGTGVPPVQRENGQDARFPKSGQPDSVPMRREFVILRELVKQHTKQTEVGNPERLSNVDRHLRERLATAPNENLTDAEKAILEDARKLFPEASE